jgi:hypothetical protein
VLAGILLRVGFEIIDWSFLRLDPRLSLLTAGLLMLGWLLREP